jgi:hypothetical protein
MRFDKLSVLIPVLFILLAIYASKMDDVDISLFDRAIKLIVLDLQEDARHFLYTINKFIFQFAVPV